MSFLLQYTSGSRLLKKKKKNAEILHATLHFCHSARRKWGGLSFRQKEDRRLQRRTLQFDGFSNFSFHGRARLHAEMRLIKKLSVRAKERGQGDSESPACQIYRLRTSSFAMPSFAERHTPKEGQRQGKSRAGKSGVRRGLSEPAPNCN